MKKRTASALLILVAFLWGSSLIVAKSSLDNISPSLLIALRFSIACILLSIFFHKKLKDINPEAVVSGAIVGAFLFGAYWIQTLGIALALPGKSAFLSSIYCVLVPFATWLMCRKKPKARNLIAAAICATGIAFASVTKDFSIVAGDLLALLSGVFYALHISSIGKYGTKKDPILMTILQFAFCAAYAWGATCILDGFSVSFDWSVTPQVLYLAVFCTAIALLLQNIGQKYADPSRASILMSTEAIWGVILSMIFFGETVTIKMAIGFVLIFASVLISELHKTGEVI